VSESSSIKVVDDGRQRYIVCFPCDYHKDHLRTSGPSGPADEAIAPAGELVEAVKAAVRTSGKTPAEAIAGGIILDLAEVEYMNSGGLGAIFALRKFARENNARMVVARPTPTITRLLDTANVPALIPVVAGLDEARNVLKELNEALGEMEQLESSARQARQKRDD